MACSKKTDMVIIYLRTLRRKVVLCSNMTDMVSKHSRGKKRNMATNSQKSDMVTCRFLRNYWRGQLRAMEQMRIRQEMQSIRSQDILL